MLKIILAIALLIIVSVFAARKISGTVRVERNFDAPVARVWKLWTDEEAMKKWWSPNGYTAPVIKNDFRVGGSYLFSMRSPSGEMHWNTGIYKEIVSQQKIVSTLSFANEAGQAIAGTEVKLPGDWPDEITVTVRFAETNGKTTVSIVETGVPLIMKFFAGLGWQQQLDKFDALL